MQLWVLCDCEIEHERYTAGQALEVSDVLGTHLQRCSPESFTDVDPAVATVKALEAEPEEPEAKALDKPPADKMIPGAPKSK